MGWLEDNRAWLDSALEHWGPKNPEPLCLRAWLTAPVACDGYDPITIEGALQYAVILQETGRVPDDVFAECPKKLSVLEVDVPTPIADSNAFGDVPISCASIGFFSSDAVSTSRWRRKRPRAESYSKSVVNLSMADMKASNMPASTVSSLYVDFFVLGDLNRLKTLLRDVPYLGAKRSGGLGLVQAWEVIEERSDWSIVGPQGRLMRSLPASTKYSPFRSELREATLRAPYWHHRTRCMCYVPVVHNFGEPLC